MIQQDNVDTPYISVYFLCGSGLLLKTSADHQRAPRNTTSRSHTDYNHGITIFQYEWVGVKN